MAANPDDDRQVSRPSTSSDSNTTESPPIDCPTCGEPIRAISAIGPDDHVADPCGHRVGVDLHVRALGPDASDDARDPAAPSPATGGDH